MLLAHTNAGAATELVKRAGTMYESNLLNLVHELHAPCAAGALLGGAAVAERVHHVTGEDEEQVGGAPVADGAERAQDHEQHVHPVREPEHAADAHRRRVAAGARRGAHLIFSSPPSSIAR
jgi:hypothetical protein